MSIYAWRDLRGTTARIRTLARLREKSQTGQAAVQAEQALFLNPMRRAVTGAELDDAAVARIKAMGRLRGFYGSMEHTRARFALAMRHEKALDSLINKLLTPAHPGNRVLLAYGNANFPATGLNLPPGPVRYVGVPYPY